MLRGLYLSTLRWYAELILCYTMDSVEWELAEQLLRVYFIGGFPWIFLNNLPTLDELVGHWFFQTVSELFSESILIQWKIH